MKRILVILIILSSFVFGFDIGGFAKSMLGETSVSKTSNIQKTGLSNSTVTSGLKEALKKGVRYAANSLGKKNGYLNNSLVKIPLPKSLENTEKIVRKFSGDKIADNLIESMNNAASYAAPKTVDIFIKAIEKMSLDDAKKILVGNKDAATQYFKNRTSSSLEKMISPIVDKTMKQNSVVKYYRIFDNYYKKYAKEYVQNSGIMKMTKNFGVDSYIPSSNDENLNKYVTSKAIDGLFKMIAQKEADIRANPVARTSSILKKVFGN